MTLSFIVAISDNHAIGKKGQLPWHLPEDLKFFKRITLGKPVLMGRKTYESLRKPLPGRVNIVISSKSDLALPEGVLKFSSLEEGISYMQSMDAEEGFVIGGGQIFEQAMPDADRMYITHVRTSVEGADAFFPQIDHTHWKCVWEEPHEADEKHKYSFIFRKYERIEL